MGSGIVGRSKVVSRDSTDANNIVQPASNSGALEISGDLLPSTSGASGAGVQLADVGGMPSPAGEDPCECVRIRAAAPSDFHGRAIWLSASGMSLPVAGPILLHLDFASCQWDAGGCAPLVVTGQSWK